MPLDWLYSHKLHSLGLSWGNDNEGNSDQFSTRQAAGGTSVVPDEEVLYMLHPNNILRRLSITKYSGIRFPKWTNGTELPNLTELVLINCKRCEDLPTFGQLPFLKFLNIQGMDAVVTIDSKFYGEGDRRPFPSLNVLTLRDFPNLKPWKNIDSKEAFTCLDRLCIIKCPSLITMPWFPFLRHLELRKCNPLVLRSAADLNLLSTLAIVDFPELSFLQEALLENNLLLTSLTISSCPRLGSLPRSLGKLTALKSLTISWCDELDTLPHGLGNLTSLSTLEIIECPGLVSFPMGSMEGLSSVRSLSIKNCANLTSLPSGMEHLRALEHLTIMYCPKLAYLQDGLQQLTPFEV